MTLLLLILIYVAFISLGLPDALLGAGWPVMQMDMSVPYSSAGIISFVISSGTIISSIFSNKVLNRFGIGKVTAVSVALTALALLIFSFSPSFIVLILGALPLGLGAGSVDAGLNAYVAKHYKAKHMNWLHSFWGLGALAGPMVLSVLLTQGLTWRNAYFSVGLFQSVLVIILFLALPLWTKVKNQLPQEPIEQASSRQKLLAPLQIKGVPWAMLVLFAYCGIEASAGLWGASFLNKAKGLEPAYAAIWVSLFYASITLGRFITGFASKRLSNNTLIRLGGIIILLAVGLMLAPLPLGITLSGFLALGFGCAPIYPAMLHETPVRFGNKNAQAVMGFQMATAYTGTTLLPPLFGLIAGAQALFLLPFFLLSYIILLLLGFEKLKSYKSAKTLAA